MTTPDPFAPGYRLTDGNQLNQVTANPVWSVTESVSATVGGTMQTSAKIVNAVTNITAAAVPGAGITLPQALQGTVLFVNNNSANDVRVFAAGNSRIDGLDGQIGILLAKGTAGVFCATATKEWTQLNTTGNPNVQTVSTIAELRSLSVPSFKAVFVEGYYKDGDGGGGYFYPAPLVENAEFTGRIFYTGKANSSLGSINNNTNTITVADGSIFYVGMSATINSIGAGSITNISGNTITLSATWTGGTLTNVVFAGYSYTGGAQLTLVVSSMASGTIYHGMKVTAAGISVPLFVAQQISGVSGGVGVYQLLAGNLEPVNITVPSQQMTGIYYSDDGGMTIVPSSPIGIQAWLRAGVIIAPGRQNRYFDDQLNVKWFGAIGDGVKRTLNTYYPTLALAQAIYPFATDVTTQTVDWAGIQAAINWAQGYTNRQYSAWMPSGAYMTSHPILINSPGGGRVNGQRFVGVYDGAYINYDGNYWALLLQNRYFNSVSTTATITGSTNIVSVASTANMYVGMNCKIDGSSWSTIKSIDSSTQLTLNDAYGPAVTGVPFEAFTYAYSYSGILNEFGIVCSQPCLGAIYGKMLNQYEFKYLVLQGSGGQVPFPQTNFGCQFGFYLDDFALSYITYCWPTYFETCIYAEGGEFWIQNCNIFAMSKGIRTGYGNFFIENNYFEWFDNAVLVATKGPYNQNISSTGSVIRDNVFGANTPSSAKTGVLIFDVDGTSIIDIESLTIAGNSFKGWNGGAANAGIVFNINPANTLVKVSADVHNNSFHGVSLAGISVNDPRVCLSQYGNVSFDSLGFSANRMPNVYTTFGGAAGSFLSASYSVFRSNFYKTAPADTAENVLVSFQIPANVVGLNGSIRITANWSVTNNTNHKYVYIKQTNAAGMVIATANLDKTSGGRMIAELYATNSTTYQTTNFNTTLNGVHSQCGNSVLTADFKAPVTFVITAQKANASDDVTLLSALVEVLPC